MAALGLAPELLANFNRGPFLQDSRTNQITVAWKTPVASDSRVDYGLTTNLGSNVSSPDIVTMHALTLENLRPGLTYYYRVQSTSGTNVAQSPVYPFQSAKATGDVCFVVLGDSGTGSQGQVDIAEVMRQTEAELVLHVGDIVYPSFELGQEDSKCLDVYREHMHHVPYYFAIGNHDLVDFAMPAPGDASAFLETFYLPTNSTTGTEHFYSFDHGDVHFAVLSSDVRLYPYTNGSPQYLWLAADLAASSKPWKFMFFHHPPFTSGLHRFDDVNTNGIPDRFEIRDSIIALAESNGVQLVIFGHDHFHEKFNPVNGVHFVLTGAGGGGLRAINLFSFNKDPASSQQWSRFSCVKVKTEGDRLSLEALADDGSVFDTLFIQRALPPPQTNRATWHSPGIEPGPANDGDGNINGQQFDFIGHPIPTLPGRFSNLGRVYVNNDSSNLFVGFEQTLFYPDNNVFLFVETPGLAGVSNLIGIGNATVDPGGQGADGLDFLRNLFFTNFTPAVSAILGDEYGDGQFRRFTRPTLGLNIGQGVFRLDPSISNVPHFRLQQYNRSPQAGGVAYERNANFIELAIPYTELGDLIPGALIKLGAVTAGGAFDPGAQTRSLDTGFLGNGFSGGGSTTTWLEGLTVRLAGPDEDPDGDGLSNLSEATFGTHPEKSDTDGDTLRDGWELTFGLDPLSGTGADGPQGDPDNDRFPNWMEQVAGTDPTNALSRLVAEIERVDTNQVAIKWASTSNRTYGLARTTNLLTSFTFIATNLPAAWPENTYTDFTGNTNRAYYLLEVRP